MSMFRKIKKSHKVIKSRSRSKGEKKIIKVHLHGLTTKYFFRQETVIAMKDFWFVYFSSASENWLQNAYKIT